MKKHLIITLLLVATALLPACAGKRTADTTAMPPLDQEALLTNLGRYFSQVSGEEKPKYSHKDFRILASQGVQIGPNTYYALKIGAPEGGNTDNGLPLPLTIIADPTGTLALNSVMDLRLGREAILSRAPAVTRVEFPKSVTPTVVMTGQGKTDIIFVGDPFCSHCRNGYAFLADHKAQIGSVRLAHNPLVPGNGSAAATWTIEYAVDRHIRADEALAFSFTELKPSRADTPTRAAMDILKQYHARFPELFDEAGGDVGAFYNQLKVEFAPAMIRNHNELKKAGFNSSPFFIIGETVVKGMNEKALIEVLGGTDSATVAGGICSDDSPSEDCNQ